MEKDRYVSGRKYYKKSLVIARIFFLNFGIACCYSRQAVPDDRPFRIGRRIIHL
jgi:hypothetical protein